MKRYFKKFENFGICELKIDLVCNHWNDRFSISTWTGNDETYNFVIKGKRLGSVLCKSKISKSQAIEIAKRMNLIHVKDSTFNSAGSLLTKSAIESEIERILAIKRKKEAELSVITTLLYSLERSI